MIFLLVVISKQHTEGKREEKRDCDTSSTRGNVLGNYSPDCSSLKPVFLRDSRSLHRAVLVVPFWNEKVGFASGMTKPQSYSCSPLQDRREHAKPCHKHSFYGKTSHGEPQNPNPPMEALSQGQSLAQREASPGRDSGGVTWVGFPWERGVIPGSPTAAELPAASHGLPKQLRKAGMESLATAQSQTIPAPPVPPRSAANPGKGFGKIHSFFCTKIHTQEGPPNFSHPRCQCCRPSLTPSMCEHP